MYYGKLYLSHGLHKSPVTTRCFLLPRLSVTAIISEERMLSVRKHGDK